MIKFSVGITFVRGHFVIQIWTHSDTCDLINLVKIFKGVLTIAIVVINTSDFILSAWTS